MRVLLYYIFKVLIKTGFFFYAKKIKISGKENIPKKGAILFTANHPNGLLDPILIASNISRKTHFLVKADVFKNPKVATFFDWLGMMPVYRIRDGINQLAKNNLIFEKCRALLKNEKALLIFPEGSHMRKRTIRPLSKGFTRILFGALDENPNLKISVIPVGITYQNSSKYPSEIALQIGKPISANEFYNTEELHKSTLNLKQEVTKQLQALTVHITNDENYETIEANLNHLTIDFTEVTTTNKLIQTNKYNDIKKRPKKRKSILKLLIIINSFIPYFLWKAIDKKITEIEFKDTFRYGINMITFPLFYFINSLIISYFFNWKAGFIYFSCSLFLVLLHTKIAFTNR